MAIKDPTAAVFRRQSGANLLLIGQNEEAALAIVLAMLTSLAAQQPVGESRFYILDGTPEDAPHTGTLERVAGIFPHEMKVGGWRDTAAIVGEIAQEVQRRQDPDAPNTGPIHLIVFDLTRFRDLRKSDDDFSFSRRDDEPASPSQQFTEILRDGPGVGVHVTVWCDSLNNLNRAFDRASLREFEMRILFQMSPNDSSTLIDTPAAGRLGFHRALFSYEEEGRLEKFRPYGLPPDDWWEWVRQRFQERGSEVQADT